MRRIVVVALMAVMAGATLRSSPAEEPKPKADELQMKSDKMELKVEIPQLNVSEYHRPYVAMWIQNEKQEVVTNLAVWYQLKGTTDGAGTKWLPDLRQWWRRSGRNIEFPADGISAPSRPVGEHTVTIDDQKLAKLSPGKYVLLVEAAREVGGRELLEIPFHWPGDKSVTYQVAGKKELGKITLTVKP
ncbi:hypothetical protein Pan44_38240 [Caulifigura coniformis]|uniref:DUF2271 domain-containing protein n=1 Tax=Caulifigura coniformis TaxID=2527983 RepID=A0A517SI25_9PLAN|nr:DUF2271 domain-containing protein [Caulifigura coniformis]QDT55776.1 hypothetical protein Pan44_38240 [Caulifigura coniformis]